MPPQFRAQHGARDRLRPPLQHRGEPLAAQRIGGAEHRRMGDRRMRLQHRLDFFGNDGPSGGENAP